MQAPTRDVLQISWPLPSGDRHEETVKLYHPTVRKTEWLEWDVVFLLREAWWTLRRLPSDRPKDMKAGWPDVVQEAVEAYGWNEVETRVQPTALQIDRMDLVMDLVYGIDGKRKRGALWGVAMGHSSKAIGRELGVSKETARQDARSALKLVQARLNGIDAVDPEWLFRGDEKKLA